MMVTSMHPMIDGFMTKEYLSSAEETKEQRRDGCLKSRVLK